MKYLIALILLGSFTFQACKTEEKKAEESKKVDISQIKTPEILTSFDQLDEKYFHSKDTTMIINFWATWCKPCVEELPYFNTVAEQYKGKPVKFVFVSLDFMNNIDKTLKPFVAKKPLNGEVVLLADQDVNNWGEKLDRNWDGAIPLTVLIKNEKIIPRHKPFKDVEDLNSFIQTNL